jgi:ankyrin repeat protein
MPLIIDIQRLLNCFLTFGSEVNNKTKEPTDTPLHFAAINGDIQIVEMLLNRGARINAKNYYGLTPLNYAIKIICYVVYCITY